ncbi:MAG: LLM class flavin-dependent oxidoreductase [Actinobacteria bacterium]|nr:LLM class flavin-dependent oxidoreductase [Actinomycetota bacterium]
MDVGLLSLGDHLTDPVTQVRVTQAQRHRSLVEQSVLAEQVGFRSVHLGEHHFCDYILSAPPIVLAAIAERTTTLRLSTGVTLGANLDPVRVAEDYATVDLLSGGRVEPVIGRGTAFPHTFAAFGQDAADARAAFDEHVELLVRIWETDGPVTWSGHHRAALDGVQVLPRPMQTPRPPMWLGAGSVESVELAARLGLWLILPTVFGRPEAFVPVVERYLAGWESAGRARSDARIGCVSHCHVAATSQEARATWEPRYTAYMTWVTEFIATGMGITTIPSFDYDSTVGSMALCGSPAEVLDRMGQLRELLHLDTHLVMFDMGGLPEAELHRTITMFGTEVIPELA